MMTDPQPRPMPDLPETALTPPEQFLRDAAAVGVDFEEGDVERLGLYLALLLHANRSFNLTSITDEAEAWTRHILDSLTLLALLAELPEGARVADIGSGGGAPAIPLAIVMPRLRFTLIEATGKKADFLRDVARRLGLKNVEVVNERAETVGQDHKNRRDVYDAVTARAVGKIAVVAELTVPLAKVGGQILLIKGEKAPEELEEAAVALDILRASCAGAVETPTGRIVVLEKLAKTSRIYPRRPGEPKRAPL